MKTMHAVEDNVNIVHTNTGFMSFGHDEELIEREPVTLNLKSSFQQCKD